MSSGSAFFRIVVNYLHEISQILIPDSSQHLFADAVRKMSAIISKRKASTKGNLSLVMQTIIMFATYLIPFVLILLVPMNSWLAILMAVIMGVGTAGIGMSVMHGAAHGSYSSKEWINKMFASTMYALGGNVFNWKVQHNILHHTYTNIDEYDPDIASKGPIRLSDHSPVRKIHRYQYIHAFFFMAS